MRLAIVSDVHGNLPALNAVIEDAEREGADQFIFAGDYCLSNPWPDECITRMKNLKSAYSIRGNEEKYIENLIGKDQSTWTDGQMQISYWCYQKISPENRDYMLALPSQMELAFHGVPLHISHSSADFILDSEQGEWNPAKVSERYGDRLIHQLSGTIYIDILRVTGSFKRGLGLYQTASIFLGILIFSGAINPITGKRF